MKRLQLLGLGLGSAVLLFASACHSGVPSTPFASTRESSLRHGSGSGCATSASFNAVVCVRVPNSAPTPASIRVTDSLFGTAGVVALPTQQPANCSPSGSERVCRFAFNAPVTINQIQVDSFAQSGHGIASGTFPLNVTASGSAASAVLGGTVSAITIVPFLDTGLPACSTQSRSSLPVGQREQVWFEANDSLCSVIIGTYKYAISLSAGSSNLQPSTNTLRSSEDAEKLSIVWGPGESDASGSGSQQATLAASSSSGPSGSATIEAASGVANIAQRQNYNTARLGAGPVVTDSNGNVYFAMNDEACHAVKRCIGQIGRFTPSSHSFSYVGLPNVPGASQLYIAGSGSSATLWIASFQPQGEWGASLPIYHVALNDFTSSGLRELSESTFGEGSGFYADGSGNIYISGCLGTDCSPRHNGTPVVIETLADGSGSQPEAIADMKMSCAPFGYLGYSVGDVGYNNGALYVIGLNDGSPPPAAGVVWYVPLPLSSATATCVASYPANFDPSPFFVNAAGTLIFGVGGNRYNVRWAYPSGFYALEGSGSQSSVIEDLTPRGTATHLSADGSAVYYVANGIRDIQVYGLGTFDPTATSSGLSGHWNVFPSGSFKGSQWDNGVAAVSNGAWFTAGNICGNWKGVCLERARYFGEWGPIPAVQLLSGGQTLGQGSTVTFGAVNPLLAHSGPFTAELIAGTQSCSAPAPLNSYRLTFSVRGVSGGPCLIALTDKGGRAQYFVTQVSGSERRARPAPRRRSAAPR